MAIMNLAMRINLKKGFTFCETSHRPQHFLRKMTGISRCSESRQFGL